MAELNEKCKCRICGDENAVINKYTENGIAFYGCLICGKYILTRSASTMLNDMYANHSNKSNYQNMLGAYLFYNKIKDRYAFIGTESEFEHYKNYNPQSSAFLVEPETVNIWYPNTFSERIDKIMLYFNKKTRYIGETLKICYINLVDVFFIETEGGMNAINTKCHDSFVSQIKYYIDYLSDTGLVNILDVDTRSLWSKNIGIQITPKGYEKIYDLLKTQANNKHVFVAMRFGDTTRELREKIKDGIRLAGYEPRIMDEIEHNHQIVPEMLYEIKNSRFVVAELSHHNNGAYYEAGYAYGLNKEVIHICSKEALENELHFDVAQINTIVYTDIDEIPEKLKNRIRATII